MASDASSGGQGGRGVPGTADSAPGDGEREAASGEQACGRWGRERRREAP